MATTWMPNDIAPICQGQENNLTQCSPAGFMFLSLLVQLFGGVTYSINYPKHNPYTSPPQITNSSVTKSNEDFNSLAENDSNLKQHESLNSNTDDSTINTETKEKERMAKRRNKAKEYDFIIVGAGSAGCVVANRLSEVKKWKILLLEAGPEEPDVSMVPSLASILSGSTVDWGYKTQPEPLACSSYSGQSCVLPRGRTMGGSSAINYIVYMRGNKLDYDHWADLGNHGWSYNELLPYFKKSENNRAVEGYDTQHHGVGGPITVERYPYLDANTVMLVEAFKESGLPVVDLTGENNIGTNIALSTSKDGRRMSINVAYIKPIRDIRPNIDIVVNAFVTKLLIDPKTKTTFGVTYVKNGVTYNVFAKKEVIVSCGALNSPKLLMLSGIGPKSHLKDLHIPIIADLAVGKNLQDHVTTNGLTVALSNKTSTLIDQKDILQELKNYHQQKHKKSGPLTTTGTLNSVGFIKTKYASVNAPDIQFHFDARNVEGFLSDPLTFLATQVFPLAFYNGFSPKPILLTPKSRGFILLNSTDPINSPPLIYPRLFTVKEDLDTLIEGIRYAVSLEETEAFKQNGAYYVKVPLKNCEGHIWGSYDYFGCILLQYTTTVFHPVGTCKMGPAWDREAVVDQRLRVYGIKRLRVIDGSIMPCIVRGNTNIPIVTIAERACDLIKEDYHIKDGHHL